MVDSPTRESNLFATNRPILLKFNLELWDIYVTIFTTIIPSKICNRKSLHYNNNIINHLSNKKIDYFK